MVVWLSQLANMRAEELVKENPFKAPTWFCFVLTCLSLINALSTGLSAPFSEPQTISELNQNILHHDGFTKLAISLASFFILFGLAAWHRQKGDKDKNG